MSFPRPSTPFIWPIIRGICVVALVVSFGLWIRGPAKGETINELRAAHGLRQLVVDGEAAAYAQQQAYAMASTGRKCSRSADHDGTLFHNTDSSVTRAENVSCGCTNATCTIQRWIASPPHRANILSKWAGRYGISSATSRSGSVFWAMEIRP